MSAEDRLGVASNAAAGALFGVGTGRQNLTPEQIAAAETIGRRVLEHVDEYDGQDRAAARTDEPEPPTFWERFRDPVADDVTEVNVGNMSYGIGVGGGVGPDGQAMVGPALRPIVGPMLCDEALVTAAWIVMLADPLGKRFPGILERIANT